MNWENKGTLLYKEIEFRNQAELAECLLTIAKHSDQVNHHADMEIRYNRLCISITTHETGNLTEKDFELSNVIDALIHNFSIYNS